MHIDFSTGMDHYGEIARSYGENSNTLNKKLLSKYIIKYLMSKGGPTLIKLFIKLYNIKYTKLH